MYPDDPAMRTTQIEEALTISRDLSYKIERLTNSLEFQVYAVMSMSPSRRLAHAGAILFLTSIILELCNSYIPLFNFSSLLISVMLVGGIITFILSSLCEIFIKIQQVRSIASEVEQIQEKQSEILRRL